MPEGHSIRALGDRWAQHIGTAFNITSPSGRVAAVSIDHKALTRVDVKGKHLFLGFENSLWLHIHLGRFGNFRWHTGTPTGPAANVRVRFTTPAMWVDLVGPITSKVITEPEQEQVLAALGADPLRGDAPEPACDQINRSPFGHSNPCILGLHPNCL